MPEVAAAIPEVPSVHGTTATSRYIWVGKPYGIQARVWNFIEVGTIFIIFCHE